METKKSFLQTAEAIRFFSSMPKTDLFVQSIGYHNFNHIKPYKFLRSQSFYTLHIVLAGSGTLMVGEKTYDVGKGKIFVLPDDIHFYYYPKNCDPWEYVFIEFNGEKAKEYVQQIGYSTQNPLFNCFTFAKLETMLFDFFNSANPSHFKALALLHSLFDSTISAYETETRISEEKLATNVKTLIESRYFDPYFGVENIVHLTHFSHSYLCRIFKKQTGKTIVAYLNDRRMEQAESLLKNTDLTIVEIAQTVGYKEYTYFLMLFKKIHKTTALQYRKTHKHNQPL